MLSLLRQNYIRKCFTSLLPKSAAFTLPQVLYLSTKGENKVIKNTQIKQETLRVVYINPDTNKSEHKILSRMDAISFARGFGMDLVLMNGTVDPPVCKLIDAAAKVVDDFKKRKLMKDNSSKTKPIKEIFIGTVIDPHDLDTKISKVKTFLSDGHQVRIGVLAKKRSLEKDSGAIQRTVLRIVELTEDFVSTVLQPPSNSSLRKDLVLTPKRSVVSAAERVELS